MSGRAHRRRVQLRCHGAVQGVGFRPTVHRLASGLGLAGWVANDPGGATVTVEGPAAVVDLFVSELPASLPPLARLTGLEIVEGTPTGERRFTVRSSAPGARTGALVPPDTVLCAACRREMDDPNDRRHRYPFTTCTDCGPRFSLVTELPYDRRRTSMACFPLCDLCRTEYEDPSHRRFHAEPVCCPACGPRLWLADGAGEKLASGVRAIAAAQRVLASGAVVAIKGLGGFQLACRADDDAAVRRLRERKRRPAKPLAVMVRDLDDARRLVALTPADEELLTSPRGPIVLAPARPGAPVSNLIAPGTGDLGVLLPTTPLHVELVRDATLPPLVMTSGNRAGEPICRGNREALARLTGLADRFLLHDRDIVRRVDDSVARSTASGPILVRRARGWVPEPLSLPEPASEPVTAVGGHLQSTACIAAGEQAFPSQHVGDLDGEPARAFLREAIEGLESFLQVRPALIACDAHPDYPSSWLAGELAAARGGQVVRVQHHLAHAAAALAEHGAFPAAGETVLAVALDGTGWGPDGTAWGGEWLSIDGDLRWRRLAHLEPLPLVGGEAAVRQPWRVAAAALALEGAERLLPRLPLAALVPSKRLAEVAYLAGTGRWPVATGAGRVFEAAAALLGLVAENSWEGEGAMRLEGCAAGVARPWPEVRLAGGTGSPRLPSAALLTATALRLMAGEPPPMVAAGFHTTFAALAAELTCRCAPEGVHTVALGGGVMVNRILLEELPRRLEPHGFEVLTPRQVPPGDGGLAYGQAVIAAVAAARGVSPARCWRPQSLPQEEAPCVLPSPCG